MKPEQREALRSTVADLIGRTVDTWNGYNRQRPALFAEIAEHLDAAGLLQSPESAAELVQLRARDAELESRAARYRTAWARARSRALSTGGAADRYAARARAMQTALQDAVALLLTVQMERDVARARVAELEASALERAQAGLARLAADVQAAATDPNPEHTHNSVMARGEMDEPLGYYICGICGKRAGGEVR